MSRVARLEHTLFVYGTLKRFFANHLRYLGVAEQHCGAAFVGRAETVDCFPLVVRPPHMPPIGRCGPVLMDRKGTGHCIKGEIFKIDDDTLEAMDILEGVKSGAYYKETINVTMTVTAGMKEESQQLSCIAYLYPANDELLELEHFSEYTAEHHNRYRPGPVQKEILELCRIKGRKFSDNVVVHSLATQLPCTMTTHCLRLLPGDDIIRSLRVFVQSHEIDAAAILTVVGSTGRTTLRPAGVPTPKVFDGKYEIVSLTGTISRHSPHDHHLHMSISDSNCSVFGGHMMEGCIVRTTAEIVIGIIQGATFTRSKDKRTGYDELSINHDHEAAKRFKYDT